MAYTRRFDGLAVHDLWLVLELAGSSQRRFVKDSAGPILALGPVCAKDNYEVDW